MDENAGSTPVTSAKQGDFMECLECGKDTSNPKFCSRSCSTSHANKKSSKRKPEGSCKECGAQIKSGLAFCKEHVPNRDMTMRDAIYLKHHKSSAYALVRSRARASVKNEPQCCEVCGYDKHVEVAHVRAIASFEMDTMLSVINDRPNLRLLCPNHHWELDNL